MMFGTHVTSVDDDLRPWFILLEPVVVLSETRAFFSVEVLFLTHLPVTALFTFYFHSLAPPSHSFSFPFSPSLVLNLRISIFLAFIALCSHILSCYPRILFGVGDAFICIRLAESFPPIWSGTLLKFWKFFSTFFCKIYIKAVRYVPFIYPSCPSIQCKYGSKNQP